VTLDLDERFDRWKTVLGAPSFEETLVSEDARIV
jgi:hypothetical protein